MGGGGGAHLRRENNYERAMACALDGGKIKETIPTNERSRVQLSQPMRRRLPDSPLIRIKVWDLLRSVFLQ